MTEPTVELISIKPTNLTIRVDKEYLLKDNLDKRDTTPAYGVGSPSDA